MKLTKHQIDILDTVLQVSPNIILRKYRTDCCIAASRILTEVIKKLHFKDVKPLTVEVNVFNETYVKKGHTPKTEEEAQEWLKEGAWQVVVGERGPKQRHDSWPGHLVVLINNEYLIDVTIQVANRPEKNIKLGPIFTVVPEGFPKGEDKCGLVANNCLVVYNAYPEDLSYQKAHDWLNKEKAMDVVKDIIDEVRRERKG